MTRRALLVAGAGGAGALVLAGCSSSGSDGSGGSTDAATSAQPPAASSSSSSSSGSAAPESASGTAVGTPLASLADIEVGQAKSVKLANGSNGIVTRTGTGTAVAFSARCTHEGCTVKPDGTKLSCPCHQSMFDAATGAVLSGPAPSSLRKVAVMIAGGEVLES